MRVQRQRVGTVEVIAPSAALADEDVEQFSKVIKELLTAPNPRLVFDMAEVAYMDSAALESFLEFSDELANRAARLKLARVTSTCREIFDLVGITDRFVFFEDVHHAVRSFL